MTSLTRNFSDLHLRRRSELLRAAVSGLGWPLRAYRARQLTRAFASMDDAALRDIGLTRSDVMDLAGLPLDADPSQHLRRRVRERRRA